MEGRRHVWKSASIRLRRAGPGRHPTDGQRDPMGWHLRSDLRHGQPLPHAGVSDGSSTVLDPMISSIREAFVLTGAQGAAWRTAAEAVATRAWFAAQDRVDRRRDGCDFRGTRLVGLREVGGQRRDHVVPINHVGWRTAGCRRSGLKWRMPISMICIARAAACLTAQQEQFL